MNNKGKSILRRSNLAKLGKNDIEIFPEVDFVKSKHSFDGKLLPAGYSQITFILDRKKWPRKVDSIGKEQDIMAGSFDLSMDGGQTWIQNFIGFTTWGGELLDKDKKELLFTSVTRSLPYPSDGKMMVRGGLDIFEDLKSKLTIRLE